MLLPSSLDQRLIVLHCLSNEKLYDLIQKLQDSNFAIARILQSENFYFVDKIPVLENQKLDLKEIEKLGKQYS